ncbi:lamin tail domain-containing protein [Hymenobacter crusticola]|uniref:LTD domain-containing protein n=1 Tax=Hymenobacter crusticola TaxID=1770526 RepID=A0A243WH27_9BACT|nr:lamin tail domain-containing protein [Hymenobacter crusticola]OUJ75095.1 hypothetical protein BXP70_03455 [Hymenobacter crusticola]
MRKLLLGLFTLLSFPAAAQLADSFADGNFTQNPTWAGDAASFQVNSQLQLQSNGPAITGTTLQLVTPCQAATGTTWEFYANLKLATSSGNYADVWLMADQPDLKTTGTKGYFVRLGGTPDEVALFRKDATGSPVYVVNGLDGSLASSTNNVVRVRVTRSPQNVWKLERDPTGAGTSYVTEGTATDATHQRSNYCGVLLTYSAANNRSFYFDDFRVTDATPPALVSATPVTARQLDVVYNELVDAAPSAVSYRLAGAGAPAVLTAQRDATDPALVHLTLGADLALGNNTLEARNVSDLYGNTATGPLTMSFVNKGFPVAPGVNQVLITEIMADETPTVGLPASEYLEIHNPTAGTLVDLGGVRLQKAGSTTGAVFPAGATLLPGEYAVVCGSTRATQFASFGKVFGLTNFPSLGNDGDRLLLRSRTGQTLFEVSYSDTWYKDNRKKDGGWSIEMVDLANPCAGIDNWTASTDVSGGTPGRANSTKATKPDLTPPALLRAVALTPTTVRLFFGEKLDSTTAANPALYALTPAAAITRVAPVSPDFRMVDLTLAAPLVVNKPTTVTAQRITDCVGNAAGPATSAAFALPGTPAPGDIVINEVLFNPRTGGVDFVELLNRSAQYLDVHGWQLSSETVTGTDVLDITTEPYVLAPGQLVVLTTRPDVVQNHYPTHDAAAFLAMNSFPSLPDDAGTVVVLDATGQTLDRYTYDKSQHLALLDDLNGVSLERVRPEGPSLASNFHSAASAVGYATPGRPNSQYQPDPGGDKFFRIDPEIFTPDGDGQQDLTTVNYRLNQPGYVASVTVYDAQGALVRHLVRNETLAVSGFWPWDGLSNQGRKAPVGYYVFYIELFQPSSGLKYDYKRTVVVGARL